MAKNPESDLVKALQDEPDKEYIIFKADGTIMVGVAKLVIVREPQPDEK